ncbi:hypothetical protein [Streptococcus merionis]|uniref:hypothetical protein n=1 Tax=Streptococcus merionis TaxID=400065 RepID=UPI003515121E
MTKRQPKKQAGLKSFLPKLNQLNGKTLAEIATITGYDLVPSCKRVLETARRNGKLRFEVDEDGRYWNFSSYLVPEAEEGATELSQIKIRLYVEDAINMRAIANNPAIKADVRIKATEAKQRALKYLENDYALEVLKAYGFNTDLPEIEVNE